MEILENIKLYLYDKFGDVYLITIQKQFLKNKFKEMKINLKYLGVRIESCRSFCGIGCTLGQLLELASVSEKLQKKKISS